jgi:glycosyltransferase involved in cell wall biosynthesis
MQESSGIFLSVVVPAYDEVDRIGETVRRIVEFLDSRPYCSELIIVLDGGRPGAAEAVRAASRRGRAAVRVLDNMTNRGKGFSVRHGVLAAAGQYILFADADLSLPIEGADRFIAALEEGYDVAIASRALPESIETGTRQRLRHALGRAFNLVVQRVLLPGIGDTQCGFKAFNRDAAHALFRIQRIDRFGFDVEVLRLARRFGLRIVELPVTCEYHASSSVRRIRDGTAMLLDVSAIMLNEWRGRYDAHP